MALEKARPLDKAGKTKEAAVLYRVRTTRLLFMSFLSHVTVVCTCVECWETAPFGVAARLPHA